LVGIMGLGLTYYLISIKDNTLFERNYLSRDLALTTSIIENSPQDIEFEYAMYSGDTVLHKFEFVWLDSNVFVSEKTGNKKVFPYLSHDGSFDADIKEPQKIIFSNKENKLEIKEGIS